MLNYSFKVLNFQSRLMWQNLSRESRTMHLLYCLLLSTMSAEQQRKATKQKEKENHIEQTKALSIL